MGFVSKRCCYYFCGCQEHTQSLSAKKRFAQLADSHVLCYDNTLVKDNCGALLMFQEKSAAWFILFWLPWKSVIRVNVMVSHTRWGGRGVPRRACCTNHGRCLGMLLDQGKTLTVWWRLSWKLLLFCTQTIHNCRIHLHYVNKKWTSSLSTFIELQWAHL